MFGKTSATTAVKICGVTTAEQAESIITLGADAIGLNFWPKSKRYIKPAEAETWVPQLRDRCTFVAVTVNISIAMMQDIIMSGLAHVIQLHGDEDARRVGRLMELGRPVIKALQIRDRSSLQAIGNYPCDTFLLDSYNPGLYGGEGRSFPWALAVEAMQMYPGKRFILAGGLTPENVAEAIQQVHPMAVDVASGVESAPGIKDLAKVKLFIDNARSVSPPAQ